MHGHVFTMVLNINKPRRRVQLLKISTVTHSHNQIMTRIHEVFIHAEIEQHHREVKSFLAILTQEKQ